MHKLLKELQDEHQAVLDHLHTLETVLNAEMCHPSAPETVKKVAAFFQGEFRNHFVKEEEALFPSLGQVVGVEGGPIGQMLYEHKEILRRAEEFTRAASQLDGSIEGFGAVARPAREMTEWLRDHIYKEDHCLFPMARQALSERQFAEINKKAATLVRR